MPHAAELAGVLTTPVPAVSVAAAEALAAADYGLVATASVVAGERDRNFLLLLADGRRFLLKVTNAAEPPGVTDFQTQALLHLAAADPSPLVSRLVPTRDGAATAAIADADGATLTVRLLTWLDGVPLDTRVLKPDGRRALGAALGALDRALAGFSHGFDSHPLLWDLQHADRLRPLLPAILDANERWWVSRLLDRFANHLQPRLASLRTQPIHNDLTGSNVLMHAVHDQQVAGILDFGDMVRAPAVQDLGVAAAYHLDVAAGADIFAPLYELIAGYDAANPLQEAEVALLFDLIATRLALRALIPAWRASLYPDNRDYLMRNTGRAWQVMRRVTDMEPDRGRDRLLSLWQAGRRERVA